MLQYHEQVVDSILRSKGCLAVLGRGLGVQTVVLELSRRALRDGGLDGQHAARLVLLLNTPQEEAELLLQGAAESAAWAGVRERLIVVGPDMGVEDRAQAFAKGGVFAVSARLLVPDLLVGRVLPEAIDGVIVNHAHLVGELSADAFVLQIFRRKNQRGFVHAISDRPDAFNREQGHVEKVMQRCFVHQLEIWPRIRREVQRCLQGPSQPDVCQRTLEPLPAVRQIQRHVLNIIEGILEELRKDQSLDLGHIVVGDSLFRSFDAELRRALDPSWHRLGPRTRRMVQDLSGIRELLSALLRCDAVEFHGLLESLFASEGDREVAVWLLSPDAQALLSLAKARVYEVAGGKLRRTLEPHAKWRVLLDVIEQTASEVAQASAAEDTAEEPSPLEPLQSSILGTARPAVVADSDSDSDIEVVSVSAAKRPRLAARSLPPVMPRTPAASSGLVEPRIVVIVPDEKVKRQVTSVLQRGPGATLLDAFSTHLKDHSSQAAKGRGRQVPRAAEPAAALGRSHEVGLLVREAQAVARELESLEPRSAVQLRQLPDGRTCHPRVDVLAEDGPEGALDAKLWEAQPHGVVLWEPSLPAIRALEVFCAAAAEAKASQKLSSPATLVKCEAVMDAKNPSGPGTAEPDVQLPRGSTELGKAAPQLKAHLLVFEDSIEKYRFQQALVQESTAVDGLIRARANLTIRVDDKQAAPNQEAERSSRRGGGSRTLDAMVEHKVVVDMREFRSALPFMLYLRGLKVEPVTIPVGDYILSRDICVERKAIPDLVQSLGSGRLYQQAQNMCHHYANPSLLIEFDPGKSFALQNNFSIARREVEVGARDLLGKLALIILHFPRLHLIWSPSQRFSADLFLRLKEGRYQPEAKAAAQINAEDFAHEEAAQGCEAAAAAPRPRRAAHTNSVALDVLRKLPGVTPKNMHALARRSGSLAGLAQMPEEQLADIVGQANARQLREFLDTEVAIRTALAAATEGHAAEEPAAGE